MVRDTLRVNFVCTFVWNGEFNMRSLLHFIGLLTSCDFMLFLGVFLVNF